MHEVYGLTSALESDRGEEASTRSESMRPAIVVEEPAHEISRDRGGKSRHEGSEGARADREPDCRGRQERVSSSVYDLRLMYVNMTLSV